MITPYEANLIVQRLGLRYREGSTHEVIQMIQEKDKGQAVLVPEDDKNRAELVAQVVEARTRQLLQIAYARGYKDGVNAEG